MNQMINPMAEIKVGNLETAQRRVIKELVDYGFEFKDVISINRNRYSIITGKNKNILFMFKRDPFFTFGRKFQDLGKTGKGDTINCQELDTATKLQVTDIISVFADGKVYTISLREFMEKAIKWTNNEGKEVLSIGLNEYKLLWELE